MVVVDTSAVLPAAKIPGATYYKADIGDSKKADSVFKKERPSVVFHLAGPINLRREISDLFFLKDVDFLSRTDAILDACQKSNVKKIVFISSGGAIYENAAMVPTKEDYNAHPISLYGLASLMIEKYIACYGKNYNLDFTIARLSNVYGARQWQSGFIPAMIIKMLKKENPVIYGSGLQTRDFIHIDDVVEALIILARKSENEIYNIGSNKEISLNEVFALIKELLGAQTVAEYKNPKAKETQRSALDAEKMQKKFAWQPRVSLKEGLSKTIEWYKEHG